MPRTITLDSFLSRAEALATEPAAAPRVAPSVHAFHYAETHADVLTHDAACPISREAGFEQAAVRVERIRL